MKMHSFRKKIMRTVAAIAIGGSAFQLSGCDEAVRDTILSGLESTSQTLSSSLISAFFQTLGDDPVT